MTEAPGQDPLSADLELEPALIPLPFPVHKPRVVAARQGWAWVREGFDYFMWAPGVWVRICLLGLLLLLVLGLIPGITTFSAVLNPVWIGGLMLGCHAQASGAPLKVSHLFAGFGASLRPLLITGLVLTLLQVAIFALLLGSMLGELPDAVSTTITLAPADLPLLLLRVLLALALTLPLYAAAWFAPALIVLGHQSVKAALRLSLSACVSNIGSMLVYGLVGMVLTLAAMIPLGLGLLVLMPVLCASLYLSFRDIFVD